MKFKKALSLVGLGLVSAAIMAGCGQGTGDGDVTTIRVWTDNAHERELRMEQVERFNSTIGAEKGIYIEYTVYGANWVDTIRLAAQTGEAPDLFRPNGTFIREFIEAGYLVPLTDLPGMEDFIANYEGYLVENLQVFDGEPFTLPYNLTTYKFVINRDMFDRHGIADTPATWDDVREIAQLITENGNGNEFGFALALQSYWTASAYIHRPAAHIMGHHGFNHESLQFEFYRLAPVLDAIAGMVADGSVFPGASGMDADAKRAQFAEGRVAMLPAVSFDVGVYNDQFPADFNWEVIDIPTILPGPAPYRTLADGTNLLGVGAAAVETPERAAKVAEVFRFFYSDENSAEMYEHGLYIPFRQAAIDMATSTPHQRGFTEFADVPNFLLLLPMPDNHITIEGPGINPSILSALAANPTADPLTILQDLDARLNAAIAEQLDPQILETFRAPAGRDNRAH